LSIGRCEPRSASPTSECMPNFIVVAKSNTRHSGCFRFLRTPELPSPSIVILSPVAVVILLEARHPPTDCALAGIDCYRSARVTINNLLCYLSACECHVTSASIGAGGTDSLRTQEIVHVLKSDLHKQTSRPTSSHILPLVCPIGMFASGLAREKILLVG